MTTKRDIAVLEAEWAFYHAPRSGDEFIHQLLDMSRLVGIIVLPLDAIPMLRLRPMQAGNSVDKVSCKTVIADKTRDLIWPARPDPAKSRRIAEVRLVFCGFIAVAIIGTIGARIVGLRERTTICDLATQGQATAAMRGRILDREGGY
ncbi:MAG: hypothetical protein CM15mP46_6670 [Alphaproteobacteria bacterium]|nr:MAG: hypothetical protein CM15mP46_6670 [Alphaproteobacteria bacterium]